MFYFDIYVNDVGPKSNNDLDLEYIHLHIKLFASFYVQVTGCNSFQKVNLQKRLGSEI